MQVEIKNKKVERKKKLALHEVRIKFHELSRWPNSAGAAYVLFGEAMLLVWPQDGLELPDLTYTYRH